MADNSLLITINADAKQFEAELKRIRGQTSELEGSLKQAALISGAAFASLTGIIGLTVKAYSNQQKATNQLTQAMQNQGIFSRELIDSYRDQASALQDLTGVDDDAIVAGQALLQAMIGQVEITQEMSAAAVDLGEKLGSPEAGFEALGRAINGNTRVLKQYGIEVDENLTKQERMSAIITAVNQKLGGQAAVANQGLGSIRGLKNAFGDFQEEIGKRFAPFIEKALKVTTDFFKMLAANKPLQDFIASMLFAGTVVSGLVLAVTAGGLAFLKLRAALAAAGVAASATGIAVKGLVGATGLGLLLIVASEIFLNWSTIWPRMQTIYAAFVNNISSLSSGLGDILMGAITFDPAQLRAGLAKVKETLKKGFEEATAEIKIKTPAVETAAQDPAAKAAADKAAKEEKDRENKRLATNKAQNELRLIQIQGLSKSIIDLKKEEADILKALEDERDANAIRSLKTRLDEVKKLEEAAINERILKQVEFNTLSLEEDSLFQELDEAQRAEFKEKFREGLLEEIQTINNIRAEAAAEELRQRIAVRNQFLKDEQKFGQAYALINKTMHSEIYQGSKKAFGELAQLQESSNSTLKAIGKAAAIANIIIKTAESAMNIFAGFSIIPIVGPALGAAGAAAAVAFGAEQIAKVTAAQDGGLITGGRAGVDSVPAMLTPGELVVPTRNFSEVVNAVANQRISRGEDTGAGPLAGAEQQITVGIALLGDEAEKVLTARQLEAERLGTFRKPG